MYVLFVTNPALAAKSNKPLLICQQADKHGSKHNPCQPALAIIIECESLHCSVLFQLFDACCC